MQGVRDDDLTWNFIAVPGPPPTIELIKDPERQARGALRLDYKMDDDYGVVDAKAKFAIKNGRMPPRSVRCSPRRTSR